MQQESINNLKLNPYSWQKIWLVIHSTTFTYDPHTIHFAQFILKSKRDVLYDVYDQLMSCGQSDTHSQRVYY